jgi:hypothetical protein
MGQEGLASRGNLLKQKPELSCLLGSFGEGSPVENTGCLASETHCWYCQPSQDALGAKCPPLVLQPAAGIAKRTSWIFQTMDQTSLQWTSQASLLGSRKFSDPASDSVDTRS